MNNMKESNVEINESWVKISLSHVEINESCEQNPIKTELEMNYTKKKKTSRENKAITLKA